MERIAAVILNLVLSLCASELYDRIPDLANWIVRKAASRLPEQDRIRREEEWLAHAADCRGSLQKLIHAIGVWRTASRTLVETPEAAEPKLSLMFLAVITLVMTAGDAVNVLWEVRNAAPPFYHDENIAQYIGGFDFLRISSGILITMYLIYQRIKGKVWVADLND